VPPHPIDVSNFNSDMEGREKDLAAPGSPVAANEPTLAENGETLKDLTSEI
jgi:hypothetical protein